MLGVIIAGLLVLSCILLLPDVLAIRRRRKALEKIPGLEEKFLIGHAQHFLNKSPSEIYTFLQGVYKDHGKAWKCFLLDTTMFLTADPKNMEVREPVQLFSDRLICENYLLMRITTF